MNSTQNGQKNSHILVAEGISAADVVFDKQSAVNSGWSVKATAKGRGQAWFLSQTEKGFTWVLRHYQRGGLFGRLVKNSYLFTGINKTRPVQEYELTKQLFEAGLPTAKPVAAKVQRKGMFYQGWLITETISGVVPLSTLLIQRQLNVEEWEKVAGAVSQFHRYGAYHSDLNAHNILIQLPVFKVFVIDWDKGAYLPETKDSWVPKNLARLHRSFAKIAAKESAQWQESDWQTFESAYFK